MADFLKGFALGGKEGWNIGSAMATKKGDRKRKEEDELKKWKQQYYLEGGYEWNPLKPDTDLKTVLDNLSELRKHNKKNEAKAKVEAGDVERVKGLKVKAALGRGAAGESVGPKGFGYVPTESESLAHSAGASEYLKSQRALEAAKTERAFKAIQDAKSRRDQAGLPRLTGGFPAFMSPREQAGDIDRVTALEIEAKAKKDEVDRYALGEGRAEAKKAKDRKELHSQYGPLINKAFEASRGKGREGEEWGLGTDSVYSSKDNASNFLIDAEELVNLQERFNRLVGAGKGEEFQIDALSFDDRSFLDPEYLKTSIGRMNDMSDAAIKAHITEEKKAPYTYIDVKDDDEVFQFRTWVIRPGEEDRMKPGTPEGNKWLKKANEGLELEAGVFSGSKKPLRTMKISASMLKKIMGNETLPERRKYLKSLINTPPKQYNENIPDPNYKPIFGGNRKGRAVNQPHRKAPEEVPEDLIPFPAEAVVTDKGVTVGNVTYPIGSPLGNEGGQKYEIVIINGKPYQRLVK